jgi:hypothetical protein
MGKPKLPWTTCVKCGRVKLRRKNASGWWCPPCKWEYNAKSRKKWAAEHPMRWRVYLLKQKCHRYGIDPAIFVQAYMDQDFKCAACHVDLPMPHIDHDHVTGRFRGLLCRKCNLGMYIIDDPIWHQQLVEYKRG